VHDIGPIEPGCGERHLQRVGNIACRHRRTELPDDDVTREVVEDRGKIKPTPANYFEVGEIRLPELVRRRRFVFEL